MDAGPTCLRLTSVSRFIIYNRMISGLSMRDRLRIRCEPWGVLIEKDGLLSYEKRTPAVYFIKWSTVVKHELFAAGKP
jgi:hypothetical protein